jgi:hypothetical protein
VPTRECVRINSVQGPETEGLEEWRVYAGQDEISGLGYRKALEFLIKDFLISQDTKRTT